MWKLRGTEDHVKLYKLGLNLTNGKLRWGREGYLDLQSVESDHDGLRGKLHA